VKHSVILIVGPVNGGKTTLLNGLCSRLDSEGFRLGGMLGKPPLPGKEKKDWLLSDLKSGEVRLVMTITERKGWERFGRFWVDRKVFDWANACILGAFDTTDYLVFDEIGPIDLAGGGLAPSFSAALEGYGGSIVAVVRRSLLHEIAKTFGIAVGETRIMSPDLSLDVQYDKVVYGE